MGFSGINYITSSRSSEDYISELFHSDEEEKFFSFFPRSISRFFYTTIVGVIVSTIMDCIFVEEKKLKGFL